MNVMIISGRLVKAPETRYTKNNTAVCKFTIATNEGKDKDGNEVSEFIRCTAFKKTAEFIDRYFIKGSPIMVTGRFHTDKWEKDGTTHYDSGCMVRSAEFHLAKERVVNARDIEAGDDFAEVADDVVLPF